MRPWIATFGLLTVALTMGQVPAATQAPAPAGSNAPAAAKPAGPPAWPSAETLNARRVDAERRRLFQDSRTLEFTLTTDFRAVDRDRNPASTQTFPGTLTFTDADGTPKSMPVRVRGRGHSRRNPKLCDFSPLRLEFVKNQVAGTLFEGHSAIKLGTHCRSNATFEQYVIREYTVYRVLNVLTPMSFRARLARGTYVEGATGKPIATRLGLFLEDDDDVARRLGGRVWQDRGLRFRHVDQDYFTLVALFEYMIGNTDVSLYGLHNVDVVERPDGRRFPVPYDFDYSGLVNTIYAVVDRTVFHHRSVRERVYRGPCRPLEELAPYFERFRTARPAIMALYDQQAEFNDASRSQSKAYLEEFYKVIDSPAAARAAFVNGCVKEGMM
ncbi:MAG: hypothetical protein IT184_15195 [Acidobacteria bacterium]|nr:hypothetical protein [Acidobacteriota bacterium]